MHPDLRVTWTDVHAAAGALERATQEAATLPRTTYLAYEQLDMSGSDVAEAAGEFLREWAEGLEALEESGVALHGWLLSAADRLRAEDERLAR